MKLTIGLNLATQELEEIIPLKKWTSIYLAHGLSAGGPGYQRIYINGDPASNVINIDNAPSPSVFQDTDVIKIGGMFTGQIRRIQIYSPGTFGTFKNDSIFFIILYFLI